MNLGSLGLHAARISYRLYSAPKWSSMISLVRGRQRFNLITIRASISGLHGARSGRTNLSGDLALFCQGYLKLQYSLTVTDYGQTTIVCHVSSTHGGK
jgi:predicted DNA-binding ribbon-helix-helix protein